MAHRVSFLLAASIVAILSLGAPVVAQSTGIREVTASDRSVIPLNTRLRYTTMIVLPDGEEILDVICGDRDFWVISAVQNVAHVKPAKASAETNLNLVTARGTIYSFLLSEKGAAPAGQLAPDLKVYVSAESGTPLGHQKYYGAAEVERLTRTRASYLQDTFYPEVRAVFEIAEREHLDPLGLRGSYSGAFGIPQFLPRSYLQHGVDGNGDGRVSLYNPDDAIVSCAHYLAAHGWKPRMTVAEKRRVLWAYNRSTPYIDTVLAVAARLGGR